jgi:hypothetical protein
MLFLVLIVAGALAAFGFYLNSKKEQLFEIEEPKIINEYKVFFYDDSYPKFQMTPSLEHPLGTLLEETRLVQAESEELAKRLIKVYDFYGTKTITRVELVRENVKF